jgi:hypothetical protein
MPSFPLALADLWLYAFSLIGLLLVPAALGRVVWIFPAGFAVVGLFLLAAPSALHPEQNAWTWLLLSQAPWLLLVPDLLARGRVARLLDVVPLRALLAWSLLHFMGVRHAVAALSGDLAPGFAVDIAAGETVTGIGAAFLWMLCRSEKIRFSFWFRMVLIFWNTHALFTSLALSTRLLRAHGVLPAWGDPSPEIHAHFAAWPNSLETFFWIPLAIGLHAAIFYKLFHYRADVLPPRVSVDVPHEKQASPVRPDPRF